MRRPPTRSEPGTGRRRHRGANTTTAPIPAGSSRKVRQMTKGSTRPRPTAPRPARCRGLAGVAGRGTRLAGRDRPRRPPQRPAEAVSRRQGPAPLGPLGGRRLAVPGPAPRPRPGRDLSNPTPPTSSRRRRALPDAGGRRRRGARLDAADPLPDPRRPAAHLGRRDPAAAADTPVSRAQADAPPDMESHTFTVLVLHRPAVHGVRRHRHLPGARHRSPSPTRPWSPCPGRDRRHRPVVADADPDHPDRRRQDRHQRLGRRVHLRRPGQPAAGHRRPRHQPLLHAADRA